MKFFRTFPFRLICISSLALLISLMLATSLLFEQYQNSMMEQTSEETLRSFLLAETKISRLCSDAYEAALSLRNCKEVDAYLFGSFATETDRVMACREMMHAISDSLANNHNISGVLFFRDNGTMTGATQPWRFSFEVGSHPFFKQLQSEDILPDHTVTWLGGYWLSDFTLMPPQTQTTAAIMIVGAVRTRYRYSYSDSLSTLTTLFSISEEALGECFDALNDKGEEVYLLDQNGKQLVGPNMLALSDTPWFYKALNENGSPNGANLTNGNETYQVVSHVLSDNGWMLVKAIPFEIYTKRIDRLRAVTWKISALVLLLMASVYALWALRFTRPFREISTALERVRMHDLAVRLEHPYATYEFELMREEFNQMISSIGSLLEQTKSMEHERIELELRNLQSQLNPHMVFNSITAIRWMAMMSGADNVSDMLVELTELIKPIFTEWRLTWTLREEMAYVEHYVRLLRLRYGGVLCVDMHIDERVMEHPIPCFTLQPLLENCAEHGVRPSSPLNIVLEGKAEQDSVLLCVSDNGRGMPKEKLELLRQKLLHHETKPEKSVGHTGIGLINIHRRLIMFGGPACGLMIESEENTGTKITLRLPATSRELVQQRLE